MHVWRRASDQIGTTFCLHLNTNRYNIWQESYIHIRLLMSEGNPKIFNSKGVKDSVFWVFVFSKVVAEIIFKNFFEHMLPKKWHFHCQSGEMLKMDLLYRIFLMNHSAKMWALSHKSSRIIYHWRVCMYGWRSIRMHAWYNAEHIETVSLTDSI